MVTLVRQANEDGLREALRAVLATLRMEVPLTAANRDGIST